MTANESIAMNEESEEKHHEKKVTAATTDAPQEEFIAPSNIPTKTKIPQASGEEQPKKKEDG